jgi:regulator of sigma E protease
VSFQDIPAFLLVLGVIIFVHEGGHYLLAKLFDVKVLTFSLGFGPKIVAFRKGETEYRISWIPLGGYVRLGGESPEEATGDPRDFQCKPRWQRVLIYLAGPTTNIIFSIAVIAVVLSLGFPLPFFHNVPPVVGTVEPGSAGAAAGLQPGDRVLRIAGREAKNWETVAMAILESPGKSLPVTIERDDQRMERVVVPTMVPQYSVGDAGLYPISMPNVSQVYDPSPALDAGFQSGDKLVAVDGRPLMGSLHFVEQVAARAGKPVRVTIRRDGSERDLVVTPRDDGSGKGKVGLGITEAVKLPVGQAIVESARYNWNITTQTLALVGKLITRQMKVETALHGPLEIGKLAGEAARQGLPALFHLTALVSISIAILNLLPIPVLDGGNIFVLLVESTIRRDLSLRLKEGINMVGLAFILLLMVTVIFFDVRRGYFTKAPPAPTAPVPAAGAPPVALPSPVPGVTAAPSPAR